MPSDTKTATLEVGPGSYGAIEYLNGPSAGGSLTNITFRSATVPIVIPVPVRTTPTKPRTETTSAPLPLTKARSFKVKPKGRRAIKPAIGLAAPLGVGSGVVVLVLLIPIWRRRAYRKADAEGRIIIDSPPVPISPRVISGAGVGAIATDESASNSHTAVPVSNESVTVKVLGPVEIDGLRRPIEMSPVREVLVFLALHPGRSYTSIELRSAIWVEGRTEPNANTFRNYLTDLRSSLPPETLVRSGHHYRLTEAITTDWGSFDALVDNDPSAEQLSEALALIRGAPFEGAFFGRNSPYGWSTDLIHLIEANVEKVSHELVTLDGQ